MTDKNRMPKKGEFVKVVDEFGQLHDGLVTNCWNRTTNIVYVTADDTKTDQYGNQIERQTSCMHKLDTSAPGRYWYFDGETFA
jgi:hypothetical protein